MGWKVLDANGNVKVSQSIGTISESSLVLSDVTTDNVTSTAHGFAPKSPADATKFLNGAATPAYAQPKDSDLSTTDITTNDVGITKHGFAPKSPNDVTKYLDGTGAYSVPPGTSLMLSATVRLTDAQIKTLSSVPVAVVAAPGSNLIAVPVMVSYWKDWAGTYSTGVTYALRYSGINTDITTAIGITDSAAKQAARSPVNNANSTDGVNITNTAILVRASADVTGGNAANVLVVKVVYFLHDITL